MKIDWKAVASSPGYKSLKAALIKDIGGHGRNRSGRSKKELYHLFNWVISRAQHYAIKQDIPITHVLNEWEEKRTYWWLNYYSNHEQPKLPSGKPRNVKPQSLNSCYKNDPWIKRKQPKERFHSLREVKTRGAKFNREHRLNKKPRWSPERKRKHAIYQKYEKENL